jgi:uncharacterized protein with von Willebrand factor type A (vWA) domain
MSNDDLLKMLDLEGREPAPKGEPLAITAGEETKPETPASPTALHLDDWGLRRGLDVLRGSQPLRECLAGVGNEERQGHAVADFHAAAFEPDPRLQENCVDPLRLEFIRQLLDTPDYHELHAATALNDTASEIAATAFAAQYAALHREREGEEKKEPGKDAVRGHGHGSDFGGEIAVLKHVGRALAEASREVVEAKDAAAALGMGPGAPGSNDPRVIAALYRRVRSDPTLQRICELAGRYRRVAQSRQRRKAAHGMDDMVGVVTDGDLGRLLPHELAKLAIPEFEDDTLRRLVERQVMCREYRSVEPVAKGPIIVSVDESGSMQGDKGHTAKALALALAWVARQQRRWIALVAYSGDSGERLLALPPGRWDEVALMDWLAQFIGRGSSLDVPVREMPRYYEQLRAPAGVTDVIFITDAQCRIPADLREHFIAWKQQVKARLITLVIESSPGDLAAISDEVHQVNSLAVSEAGVEHVLSV